VSATLGFWTTYPKFHVLKVETLNIRKPTSNDNCIQFIF